MAFVLVKGQSSAASRDFDFVCALKISRLRFTTITNAIENCTYLLIRSGTKWGTSALALRRKGVSYILVLFAIIASRDFESREFDSNTTLIAPRTPVRSPVVTSSSKAPFTG